MTALISSLMKEGEPIPVAVVADQQSLKQEQDAEQQDMTCPDCEKTPCECNAPVSAARDMRKKLMDALDD